MLATRGLKLMDASAEAATRVTWSTDPWLLRPSRMYLSVAHTTAFASAVSARTLIVVASDGMLRSLLRSHVVRLAGLRSILVFVFFTVISAVVGLAVALLGRRAPKMLTEMYGKLKYASEALPPVRALRRCEVVEVARGGHHCHLAEPHAVAVAIRSWL